MIEVRTTTLTALLGATLALASFGAAPPATAAEWSGNVAYTTDYRFRGISQGDRSQAVQGGFDLELDNGFYVGTWASNVGYSGFIEVDYYAGFATDLNDTTGIDVGVLWYNYPEDNSNPDLDYVELYGSVSFGDATVGAVYSNDYFAETDTFFYLYGDYSIALAENVSLDLHVGWNLFDDDAAFAAFILPGPGEDPGDDYIDFSVGVSTSAAGLDLSAAVIGTDLDEDECFGDTKLCETSLVLTVSKSL